MHVNTCAPRDWLITSPVEFLKVLEKLLAANEDAEKEKNQFYGVLREEDMPFLPKAIDQICLVGLEYWQYGPVDIAFRVGMPSDFSSGVGLMELDYIVAENFARYVLCLVSLYQLREQCPFMDEMIENYLILLSELQEEFELGLVPWHEECQSVTLGDVVPIKFKNLFKVNWLCESIH